MTNKIVEILRKIVKPACLIYAVAASFSVANFPAVKFAHFLGISQDGATLFRGFIFFIAVIILFYFAFKNFRSLKSYLSWNIFFRSAIIFLVLSALVSTLHVIFMGEVYANISISPFGQDTGFFYRRILEPALAYFLQFKGQVLYTIFHFLITYSCIYMIVLWLERKLEVKFKIWQLVSMMTAGMIIFQFQAPGYAEQVILLLCLLSIFIPMDKYGRISLIAMMFLTHESAALFLGLIFSWFYFPKEERKLYLLLVVSNYFLWWANYDFNFVNLFLGHLTLGNDNAIGIFFKNIKLAVLSVFFAYKFLWLFVLSGIYYCLKNKNYNIFWQIAAMVFIPLVLVLVPDTSRVVGWGSIGVFLAIAYSAKYLRSWIFNLILVMNLLLPSVAVGISTAGAVSYPGLYGLAIDLFKVLVKNYLM
ncbi:MAG: hypothetical protein COU29_04080 [Candidatus Magasanikbacteria bacterium CG10_big_fil_rev_8_21_14_0_10_36_32]|uniref:Uncharacterized protein n=1 Tax=Candidatus Magasanikbacteria bacterium CG10_big_fil_rev_8_21_14_0_10_36_32 TaxID=1974646 RepID=A0A2M6W5V9_9BACT|nr:MAG: hypothetical protein COU29_04080 [Candidatus Magasanikbacteria bacterium CG10_big_fil_rev_8_21_14_0_10_36_32]